MSGIEKRLRSRQASIRTKNIHFLILCNIVMELNDLLINRILFMLYYGRNIKIIIFGTKNKGLRLRHGIFTRDKILISVIHCKQTFTLYKTSMGGK